MVTLDAMVYAKDTFDVDIDSCFFHALAMSTHQETFTAIHSTARYPPTTIFRLIHSNVLSIRWLVFVGVADDYEAELIGLEYCPRRWCVRLGPRGLHIAQSARNSQVFAYLSLCHLF